MECTLNPDKISVAFVLLKIAFERYSTLAVFNSNAVKHDYELTDCNLRELDFMGSREIGKLLVIKGIISWWQEVQYQ
jgi:hypothetical protein